MTSWLILRTDFRKEAYVARQVEAMGFDAWVPVQIIACRPQIARRISAKAHLKAYREICLLPRRVFAAVPVALEADLLKIRHAVALERNAALEAISVPANQIQRWRDAIGKENTAALALARPSGKQPATWKKLHDGLLEMMDGAKAQLERAA